MEEDSWENWLSHFGVNGNCVSTTVSSLSFEEGLGNWCSPTLTSKRVHHELAPKVNTGTNKVRTSSESLQHIMSERKRRREIAEKFIALSAIIPGLKKEAINHVRQLQERIAVLEKETEKKRIKPLIITKSLLRSATWETNSNEFLPEVEARCLEKEVFIRIHCEKRKGITLRLLALLKDIHLSIASFSILPFGRCFLNIIIIAQMSEEYILTVKDLVKTLKEDILKLYSMQM